MNKDVEEEAPLWLREFDTGLAKGWREDDRLMYAECKVCGRAVYASNVPGTLEWIHFSPPQFHKPEYPAPCFTPEPQSDTVIGKQREVLPATENIFTKKMDEQPKSAEMLLFLLSAQDRFLFGEMFKRLADQLTPGEDSLFRRMLLSMKADHVYNETAAPEEKEEEVSDDNPYVPDTEGTREKAHTTQRKEEAQRPKEPKNPEGVPAKDKGHKPKKGQ